MAFPFYCLACGQMSEYSPGKGSDLAVCGHCGAEQSLPTPSMEVDQEVFRHEGREREFELAIGDEECIEQVSNHIEQHLGPISQVWHEVVSDQVHIDVHHVETPERQWLVTSGMSSRPMTVPDGLQDWAHAELCLALPNDWPLTRAAEETRRFHWPLTALQYLARLPHRYDTWLGFGHTIPNGDPAERAAEGADFCGWIVAEPQLTPEEFFELAVPGRPPIHFWAVYPIYLQELNEKLISGAGVLLEKLQAAGVTEQIDVGRVNVSLPRTRRRR
ncbi:MAG: suppressor of fused domain protein [Planctomycetaceae bacterium]